MEAEEVTAKEGTERGLNRSEKMDRAEKPDKTTQRKLLMSKLIAVSQ